MDGGKVGDFKATMYLDNIRCDYLEHMFGHNQSLIVGNGWDNNDTVKP